MSLKTTALVLPEVNGKFELREVYLDAIKPDEVLVEIHASGLCHTDISFAKGVLPCEPNAVLGHEGAGIVISTGSAVHNLAAGDKVLLSFSHCQSCGPCTSGHPAYCHTFNERNFPARRVDGTRTMYLSPPDTANGTNGGATSDDNKGIPSQFFGQSSFARHTLAHMSSCVKVPASTDLALFAPLGCGMQTGAGAVLNTLGVKPGSSVAVFGVGSVGVAGVMAAAKIAGATTVIAVDLKESRLEMAKKLGATHGVLASGRKPGEVVEEIRRICPPNGVDFALECTGVPAVVRDMIDCLGTRGRGATLGAPGFGKEVPVDVMSHLTYGKEYVGCCEGDSWPEKFIPFLLEAHGKGQFPLEEFVQYYDFKDHEKAIEDMHTGKAIKAVLKWT